jgi:DNA-binding transcriptional MerR regulator
MMLPVARVESMESTWTVRELADEFDVSTRTLRFYEAEGLLAPLRNGTTRVYAQRDRARLRLIMRGRRFGMSLEECRELIDMYDGAETSEHKQLQTLLDRLEEISADLKERRSELQRTLTEVQSVAAQCRTRLDEIAQGDPMGTES